MSSCSECGFNSFKRFMLWALFLFIVACAITPSESASDKAKKESDMIAAIGEMLDSPHDESIVLKGLDSIERYCDAFDNATRAAKVQFVIAREIARRQKK
jgi:hypothetical protein